MNPASFLEPVNKNSIHWLMFQHIFAAYNAELITKRNGQCQEPNKQWRRVDYGYKNRFFFYLRDEEKIKKWREEKK